MEFWTTVLAEWREAFATDRAYRFGIFARDTGADGPLLGTCNFSDIVRGLFQACYLGYALGERHQGQGYMTEALRAAIDFMWSNVKLHRIMANYMPHNARSANVLANLGFTIEGRADNYLFIDGAWRDHVLTSLTNPHPIAPALATAPGPT